MARPQFKNSKLPMERAITMADKVSVSFWFNIEDQALNEALEKYYVMADKKPGMEIQAKVGDQYVKVSRFSLFIDDERKNQLMTGAPQENIAPGSPPPAPMAPQAVSATPVAPTATAAPAAQAGYGTAKDGDYGF